MLVLEVIWQSLSHPRWEGVGLLLSRLVNSQVVRSLSQDSSSILCFHIFPLVFHSFLCTLLLGSADSILFLCPFPAGLMGGGHYTHSGGGTNYVCLPNNPIYDKYQRGFQGTAIIHRTEYETSSFAGFTRGGLHDHDAPCAACYVISRGAQVMIPGTNKCPSGWTREYHGYLMTSHYGHRHPSEFVCVDVDAEVVPGSHSNTNGALLYVVEGNCENELPCEPYIHGYELTCVVCTK